MSRPKHPFDVLHLRRRLPKFKISHKRDIIRRFLFGSNLTRYPTGEKGAPLNEFELDQIIIFLAASHIDDYVPSCFKSTHKHGKAVQSESVSVDGGTDLTLDGGGPGNAEGWRGVLEDELALDIDSVLSDLGDYVHGSSSSESVQEEGDDNVDGKSGDDS